MSGFLNLRDPQGQRSKTTDYFFSPLMPPSLHEITNGERMDVHMNYSKITVDLRNISFTKFTLLFIFSFKNYV